MPRNLFLLIFFFVRSEFLFSQDTTLLVAGPMLGYVEHREALIWLQVTPAVNNIQVRYYKKDNPAAIRTINYKGQLGETHNPEKIVVEMLDMNSEYAYEIFLNNQKQSFNYPLTFKTKDVWEFRKPAPDFSFIFGSCAYINDPAFDRPGESYGQDDRIFESIVKTPSDFMLWMGDNTYTREADWTSKSGMFYRYTHTRKCRNLQPLLASRPNFAIWDDHDYGPNDANGSFELKEISLQCFNDFWGNKTFGENNNPGIYTKFEWSDCEFFLMDDRYYRSDEDLNDSGTMKHYLGEQQLEWLKNGLLYSKAAFKFIATGNQVLNPLNDFECMCHYQKEYEELINFIKEYKISGVIFLSGDRHFSEIIKVKPEGMYPLYDITSSALTSRSFSKFSETKEASNPYRVVPYAVVEQNYIKMSVTGQRNNRTVTATAMNIDNKIIWEYVIRQSELKLE